MVRFSLRTVLAVASAAFLAAGCATAPSDSTGGHGAQHGATDGSSRDPLIDAPHRAMMTCRSEEPVTVLRRVKEVSFACPDLDVSATIDEIRDAGWRVVSLDIGAEEERDNHVGFPVTITVRKLF